MFDYQLFLGFPLSPSFQSQLESVSAELKVSFIQNHSDYLQFLEHEGISYLGKFLGFQVELPSLELTKTNIYSLLRLLIPDYPYDQVPLCLLAVGSEDKRKHE